MEEGMALPEAHMEELVENSGSMAGEAGGSRLRQQYHSDVLLAPEADFIVDDHVSAHSGMEVADRLTYLEQRIQMQEDEIQLLKMALADVLKRLNISEEQTAALSKKGPVKARPASLALSSRTSSNAASSLRKSSSSTLPSTTPTRYSSPSSARKSCTVSPASSVKDSPSGPPGRLTMQIFLSPLPKRTGSTKMAVDTAMQPSAYPPASGPPPEKVVNLERIKAGAGKSSTVIIPLQQKSPCQSPFSPSNTPSYKNPIKSPSQYFQICY
uniref:EMAP like 1 n=1 Tax=Astyanax mexicanus TaxID=7994 RepID=W5KFD8_ASTMX